MANNKYYQWFKLTHCGNTYSELAIVEQEDSQYCYLHNGKKVPVTDKCQRGEFPLRPASVKWKGL